MAPTGGHPSGFDNDQEGMHTRSIRSNRGVGGQIARNEQYDDLYLSGNTSSQRRGAPTSGIPDNVEQNPVAAIFSKKRGKSRGAESGVGRGAGVGRGTRGGRGGRGGQVNAAAGASAAGSGIPAGDVTQSRPIIPTIPLPRREISGGISSYGFSPSITGIPGCINDTALEDSMTFKVGSGASIGVIDTVSASTGSASTDNFTDRGSVHGFTGNNLMNNSATDTNGNRSYYSDDGAGNGSKANDIISTGGYNVSGLNVSTSCENNGTASYHFSGQNSATGERSGNYFVNGVNSESIDVATSRGLSGDVGGKIGDGSSEGMENGPISHHETGSDMAGGFNGVLHGLNGFGSGHEDFPRDDGHDVDLNRNVIGYGKGFDPDTNTGIGKSSTFRGFEGVQVADGLADDYSGALDVPFAGYAVGSGYSARDIRYDDNTISAHPTVFSAAANHSTYEADIEMGIPMDAPITVAQSTYDMLPMNIRRELWIAQIKSEAASSAVKPSSGLGAFVPSANTSRRDVSTESDSSFEVDYDDNDVHNPDQFVDGGEPDIMDYDGEDDGDAYVGIDLDNIEDDIVEHSVGVSVQQNTGSGVTDVLQLHQSRNRKPRAPNAAKLEQLNKSTRSRTVKQSLISSRSVSRNARSLGASSRTSKSVGEASFDDDTTLVSTTSRRADKSSALQSHNLGFYKLKGAWVMILTDSKMKCRLKVMLEGWFPTPKPDYTNMAPSLDKVVKFYRDKKKVRIDKGFYDENLFGMCKYLWNDVSINRGVGITLARKMAEYSMGIISDTLKGEAGVEFTRQAVKKKLENAAFLHKWNGSYTDNFGSVELENFILKYFYGRGGLANYCRKAFETSLHYNCLLFGATCLNLGLLEWVNGSHLLIPFESGAGRKKFGLLQNLLTDLMKSPVHKARIEARCGELARLGMKKLGAASSALEDEEVEDKYNFKVFFD